MTEKLYYTDSHIKNFRARILSCEKSDRGFLVTLNRTAFFPEGGGQSADTGVIGSAPVLDVQEKDGAVIHLCASPAEPGSEADCAIDWKKRFARMQNHSGEHIVSGLIHSAFGYNNVGFHMDESSVTLDVDGPLTKDELRGIEGAANEAVFSDAPVTAVFPSAEELVGMEYRSKLELTDNVRIVVIDGIDACACCAPHVKRTGEIGVIKFTDSMPHRGGTRITMICGAAALHDYFVKSDSIAEISRLLSSKQYDTPDAVRRLLRGAEEKKDDVRRLTDALIEAKISSLTPTDGNMCLFEPDFDTTALRNYVNRASALCGGICAAFSGSDGKYEYIMASRSTDLRERAREINAALSGRGGGTAEMIQGRACCCRTQIERYLN